jgi:hypothetical protein
MSVAVSSAAASSPLLSSAPLPFDVFCGVWKRTIQSRLLSTVSPAKDSCALIAVDRMPEDMTHAPKKRAGDDKRGLKYRWSIGRTMDTLRVSYTVEILDSILQPSASGAPGTAENALVPLRVSFNGKDCYGMYSPDVATLTIHLLGATNATIVYKILDDDSKLQPFAFPVLHDLEWQKINSMRLCSYRCLHH